MTKTKSKRAPKTPKPSAKTNVAHVLPTPKGWLTQTAQLGARPAVLIYVKGRLKRAYTLSKGGKGRPLTPEETSRVPKRQSWLEHDTFAVIGQVRDAQFEALAISTKAGKQLISVNGFGGMAFDTPSTRWFRSTQKAMLNSRAPPPRKLSHITVVTSLYKKRLLLQWYNRVKGDVLFTLQLKISDASVLRRSQPILNTRASKG